MLSLCCRWGSARPIRAACCAGRAFVRAAVVRDGTVPQGTTFGAFSKAAFEP